MNTRASSAHFSRFLWVIFNLGHLACFRFGQDGFGRNTGRSKIRRTPMGSVFLFGDAHTDVTVSRPSAAPDAVTSEHLAPHVSRHGLSVPRIPTGH